MAEAFKGLTIRLGADARPLNSALGSIRRQAGLAQREMNRMTKALRFNPADVKAMASKVSLLQDRMRLTAREANFMRTGLNQASDATRKLAKNTQNIYYSTQRVRDEYNDVNIKLQNLYETVARVKAKAGGVKFEDALADVKELVRGVSTTEGKVKKLKSLLFTMNGKAKGNLVIGDFGKGISGINTLIWQYKRFHDESKRLGSELEAIGHAQSFRELEYRLVAAKSEMRQAAIEAAKLKSELYSAGTKGSVARTTRELRSMDSVIDRTRAKVEQMDDAYKQMPKSIEAAVAKARALREHTNAISSVTDKLRSRLAAIESTPGFDKLEASSKDVYAEVEKMQGAWAKLRNGIDTTEDKLALVNEEMRKLVALNGREKAEGSNTWVELKSKADRYRSALVKLNAKMATVEDSLERANLQKEWVEARDALIRYEAELDRLNGKTMKRQAAANFGASVKNMGYAAYSTLTPAIMMGGRYAIQSAEEVDSAYRDMRKTVQGTESDFEHLKDAALDYGRTHVTSADQILSIEAIGGQLGITVDKLEGFSKTVSNLDIATNMDTEDIAADLGKMGSVLGMTTEDYDHFGDALVRLGNSEPAFESDIMTIATRFMGVGKVAGMSASEMLAWSTAATATGQKAEAAGSSMQRFVSKMETAVANGGDDLEQYAHVAGMSADDFAAKFRGSASDAMYSFIEGLGRMQRNGESVNQQLTEMGINNVRDKQLLEGLAQQMANATDENNVLRDSLQMSNDAWNGISDKWGDAGDAAREAEKKSQGFSGQLQIMKNNAQALAVELGEGAAPWIEKLNGLITMLSGAISGMPQWAKEFVVLGAGIAASFGPAAVAIGSVITGVTNIKQTFGAMPTAWKRVSKACDDAALSMVYSMGKVDEATGKVPKGLNKVSSVLSGVMKAAAGVGIAAGISLAIWGVTQLVNHFAELKERSDRFAESARVSNNLFEAMGETTKKAAEDVKTYNQALSETKEAADKAAQSNIDMQKDFSKSLIQVADKSKELDEVTSRIMTIGDAAKRGAELSENQLDMLREAVNKFNELNGTSYVVDETGAIRDQEGALVDLAKAFKQAADNKKLLWQAEAMKDAYTDASNAAAEAYSALQSGRKQLSEYKKNMSDAYERGDFNSVRYWQDMIYGNESLGTKGYYDEVKALENEYNKLNGEAETLSGTYDTLTNAANNTESIDSIITRFDKFSQALATNGLDADDLSDSLSFLGLGFKQLNGLSAESVQAIEEGWTGSLSQLGRLLEDNGVKLGDNAKKMMELADDAGVSGSELSAMWQEADGNADKVIEKLKEMKASNSDAAASSESVSTSLKDAEAALENAGLSSEQVKSNLEVISAFKLADKKFVVNDDGTIKILDEQVRGLDYIVVGNKVFKVSDDGTITPTTEKVENLKGKVGTLNGKTISIYADTSQANSALDNVLARFSTATAKTFIFKAKAIFDEKAGATGTFTDFPITRAIPAHAAGGITGIVTQPTMTNWGLVGEAGAEALVRWAHGTAVVPLENHRYVRPFAQTIASEMGGVGSTSITNVYLNDVLINSVPALQQATEDYLSTIARYTAMGGK